MANGQMASKFVEQSARMRQTDRQTTLHIN